MQQKPQWGVRQAVPTIVFTLVKDAKVRVLVNATNHVSVAVVVLVVVAVKDHHIVNSL